MDNSMSEKLILGTYQRLPDSVVEIHEEWSDEADRMRFNRRREELLTEREELVDNVRESAYQDWEFEDSGARYRPQNNDCWNNTGTAEGISELLDGIRDDPEYIFTGGFVAAEQVAAASKDIAEKLEDRVHEETSHPLEFVDARDEAFLEPASPQEAVYIAIEASRKDLDAIDYNKEDLAKGMRAYVAAKDTGNHPADFWGLRANSRDFIDFRYGNR